MYPTYNIWDLQIYFDTYEKDTIPLRLFKFKVGCEHKISGIVNRHRIHPCCRSPRSCLTTIYRALISLIPEKSEKCDTHDDASVTILWIRESHCWDFSSSSGQRCTFAINCSFLVFHTTLQTEIIHLSLETLWPKLWWWINAKQLASGHVHPARGSHAPVK